MRPERSTPAPSRVSSLFPALALAALAAGSAAAGPGDSAWIPLFNKADTSLANDWDIKIRGEAFNVDSRRTFRRAIVGADTVLEVNYENYTGSFGGDNGPFGHAAYKRRTFSYYLLRAEYQVWGSQVSGGPNWAVQNSGFMLHSQSMATMTTNQDFPVSLEAQLLGPGNGSSTMNLCTPGTGFFTTPTGGSASTTHCVNAASLTRAPANTGCQKVSALVLGDSLVRFMAGPNGTDSAYQFYRPVYLSGNISNPPSGLPANNTRLTSGYITVQSESHPYRFRKIEVLDLVGCMTPTTDANYKAYLVKHDSTACAGSSSLRGGVSKAALAAAPLTVSGNVLRVGGSAQVALEVYDLGGALVDRHAGRAPFQWKPSVRSGGMHLVRVSSPQGRYARKIPLF